MSRINFARLAVVALAFGMPFGAHVARAQTGLFELVPVRASGVEGVDWQLGPGPNEITLTRGGQSVAFDMYVSGWGPLGMTTYVASADCSLFDSGTRGTLEPILQRCTSAADAFCQGGDMTRPDFVFYDLPHLGPSPDIWTNCADGSPGKIRIGSTLLFGSRLDDGGTYFAATFVTDVSADAAGTFSFGIDPDPDSTYITLEDYTNSSPDTIPGLITVLPYPRFKMVPTRASGVEGVDWRFGPKRNEISLASGGQSVEFEMMIMDWGDEPLASYEGGLDCSLFSSGARGTLAPVLLDCADAAPGEFCQGVDVTRPDHVFGAQADSWWCDISATCPDGSPGRIQCGSHTLSPRVDDQGTYYGATVAVDVPSDARGRFTFDLESDPSTTYMGLAERTSLSPVTIPGLIAMPRPSFELVPTRASGVYGVDWVLGPGSNEITLVSGDQAVEFELFISGWTDVRPRAFGAELDCSLFSSGAQGSLSPILVNCYDCDGDGQGGACPPEDFCQGLYGRPDGLPGDDWHGWCDFEHNCPDGSPGKVRCNGSVDEFYSVLPVDPGVPYYAGTFATDVSGDALGTFTFGLDPDVTATYVTLDNEWVLPSDAIPGLITVLDPGGPCTVPGRPAPDARFGITDTETDTARPCTTQADCLAGLNADSEVNCIDPPAGEAGPGVCYVRTNRYISIDPNPANAGMSTARLISLDLGGGQTQILGWVGEPVSTPVPGPEPSPQLTSRIELAPYYTDWTLLDTVHVGDCETSPGHTYLIEAIEILANFGDAACYSEGLALSTVSYYGDVTGGATRTPPDGNRSFHDISATVRGFQHVQTVPRAWLDLVGGSAAPEVPQYGGINFLDISAAVAGFQGGSYSYAAPCDCSDQACP